jgi:GNAT superfamily N-acetyltransferase
MQIQQNEFKAKGIKFSAFINEKEVGRAFLFILKNDLRGKEYGFLEDVFVDEDYRRQGIGTELLNNIIAFAQENNLYKIVATSRYGRDMVRSLYERLGFKNFGIEFKMYL